MNKPFRSLNTFNNDGERASKSDELQKIYDSMKNLKAYELDSILIEMMKILPELIQTKTIAIYHYQKGNNWLRLVESLNEESIIGGKSWNLSEFPKIYDTISKGDVYQGIFNEDEPDIIIPVICENSFSFVIVIKTLPYVYKSFYYINLLKVISLLLDCYVEKALLHEEISKEENYIPNTEILNPEAFKRRVSLAQEKFERNMAEYCVIEIMHKGHLYEEAEKVSKMIRITDCMGIDDKDRLFVLLNNTNAQDSKFLRSRLQNCGIEDIKLDLC